jgi:DNA-binding winged helix-turn-helix (wHTH) protein
MPTSGGRPGDRPAPGPAAAPRSPRIILVPEDALPADLVEQLRGQDAIVLVAASPTERRDPGPPAPPGPGEPPAPPARPADPEAGAEVIRFHHLEIDLGARHVHWAHRPLDLSEHEIGLLSLLAAPAGRARSFKELFAQVWGTEYRIDPPVVHSAVRRLRRKLADAGADLRLESVRGYGFRLAGTPGAAAPSGPPPGARAGAPDAAGEPRRGISGRVPLLRLRAERD